MPEQMKPGRELDAWLAIHVKGWKRIGACWVAPPYDEMAEGAIVDSWTPSTSDALAHKIIAAMEKGAMQHEGGFVSVEIERYCDADVSYWEVDILQYLMPSIHFRGKATHPTFAGAVALAAKAANEQEEGQ